MRARTAVLFGLSAAMLAFTLSAAAHAAMLDLCGPVVGDPNTVGSSLTCSWSGIAINNPDVDPNFTPEGNAVFEFSGDTSTLKITLTYTGFDGITADPQTGLTGQNMVNTGLLWDFAPDTIAAMNVSVLTSADLVGTDADRFATFDLAEHWAYREGIVADDLGSYGIGAIGDIYFGEDSFGAHDLISGTTFENQPDGTDWGLVPNGYLWDCSTLKTSGGCTGVYPDGFQKQGPFLDNSIMVTIAYDREFGLDEIANVQPIFGSEGAPLIPEPTAALLFGVGFVVVGWAVRRDASA